MPRKPVKRVKKKKREFLFKIPGDYAYVSDVLDVLSPDERNRFMCEAIKEYNDRLNNINLNAKIDTTNKKLDTIIKILKEKEFITTTDKELIDAAISDREKLEKTLEIEDDTKKSLQSILNIW